MPKQPRDRDIAEEWPIQAFLDQFAWVEKKMEGRKFAFILGAGASVSSGIPTGGQLVDRWLRELHARDLNADGRPIEEWASNKTLSIRDYDREFKYDNRAEYYPQIYDKRFGEDPPEGYRYLESVMEKARPGVGYSMLAQILNKSRHKVVITTNFDNLVADAVLMYTNSFAQVCGHEALTSFIDVHPQRPLVAKIHRDLLLGPQNDPYRTNVLHESWAAALRNLFAVYTPIVIGYGGNDGSLMNFLYALEPESIPGGIFWCYILGGPKPNARIQELINRQSGKLLGIPGFDEFMFLLGRELKCQTQEKWIVTDATDRAKTYESQLGDVLRQIGEDAKRPDRKEMAEQVQSAIQSAVPNADKEESWIAWAVKAQLESDSDKREQIYRKGCALFPESAELLCIFAGFKTDVRREYEAAKKLLEEALNLDPENAACSACYAILLWQLGTDNDKAERLFCKAIDRDPNDPHYVGFYASFLHHVRNDYDKAETLFCRSIDLAPTEAGLVGNYALFLAEARKDDEAAERVYRKALDLDPNHVQNMSNFAELLMTSDRMKEARTMSDRAWTLNNAAPSSPTTGLCLIRGIMQRLNDQDDTAALGRLKTVFDAGFFSHIGSADSLFATVDLRLSDDDRKLYHAISKAIQDRKMVAALDEFPRWKNVDPISLDAPWPPLAEKD